MSEEHNCMNFDRYADFTIDFVEETGQWYIGAEGQLSPPIKCCPYCCEELPKKGKLIKVEIKEDPLTIEENFS